MLQVCMTRPGSPRHRLTYLLLNIKPYHGITRILSMSIRNIRLKKRSNLHLNLLKGHTNREGSMCAQRHAHTHTHTRVKDPFLRQRQKWLVMLKHERLLKSQYIVIIHKDCSLRVELLICSCAYWPSTWPVICFQTDVKYEVSLPWWLSVPASELLSRHYINYIELGCVSWPGHSLRLKLYSALWSCIKVNKKRE